HRSADEIYTEVKREHPSISRGTVYKTLEALRVLGEVRELELGVGRAHFDGMRPEAHPHTICPTCGKIEDVELPSRR
ncbi:MAG: transcriptional repressor, partial [Armatimonadota bacterium]